MLGNIELTEKGIPEEVWEKLIQYFEGLEARVKALEGRSDSEPTGMAAYKASKEIYEASAGLLERCIELIANKG